MPRLEDLVRPDQCAVVTMEIQRGVVGDLSCIPLLQKSVAEAGLIPNTQRLIVAAISAGARVIHAPAAFRPYERRLAMLAMQTPSEGGSHAAQHLSELLAKLAAATT